MAQSTASVPVLEVRDLRKVYKVKGKPDFAAVDGVSFSVSAGECLALVGASGCGKSTTAQMITYLTDVTSGTVLLNGRDVTNARGNEQRATRRHIQMVFQNPAGSFDPRRTLGEGISEGLRNAGMGKADAQARAAEVLVECGLSASFANRYPREVSGGQCQRAAIARALAVNPDLIICDEATSALDVTVQAHIVGLLSRIQRERGTALLFICHDLALVQGFCDRVLVMQAGRVVEEGPAMQVIAHPEHPYTRSLVAAVLD